MKYIFLQNNIVHEIIPESNPAFPAMPIDKRYPPLFLAQCVMVADDVDAPLGHLYENGAFLAPPIPPASEPLPEPPTIPPTPTEAELINQELVVQGQIITDLELNQIEQGQQITDLELSILGGQKNV